MSKPSIQRVAEMAINQTASFYGAKTIAKQIEKIAIRNPQYGINRISYGKHRSDKFGVYSIFVEYGVVEHDVQKIIEKMIVSPNDFQKSTNGDFYSYTKMGAFGVQIRYMKSPSQPAKNIVFDITSQKQAARKPSIQRVAFHYLKIAKKLSKKEGLDRLKKSLDFDVSGGLLLEWGVGGSSAKFEVKGDKIIYTSPIWEYLGGKENDSVIFAMTGEKDVIKKTKEMVIKHFGFVGLKVFRVKAKILEKGVAKWWDNSETGKVQAIAEVELPEYMQPETLKDIASELKKKGYYTSMNGGVLEVQFYTDELGKWEYACWDMTKRQYQNKNNELHKELAEELQDMYPQHLIKPDKGYNESGKAIAFIKMP